MLLSAALIVRDEARVLGDCLLSIREVVDEIVVVDTGSLDDSVAIARGCGARVIHHRWSDDFAQARNAGLDAAAGDWILYIDADERLHHADRPTIEQLLVDTPNIAYRLLLAPEANTTPYLEYRLWRHDPRIRFRGRIHEKVTPAIAAVAQEDGRPIGDCELLLTHLGYEGDQLHKHRRNLPLLRAELAVDPDNLFNRHHLARVLRGLGEEREAAEVLADAVELARRRPADPLGVLAFADLVRLRRERAEDADGLLAEARGRYPHNKLLIWIEAAGMIAERRYEQALVLADRLLAVDFAALPAEGPAYDRRIFGEFAHDARGICLFRLGRYEEAARAFEEAMRCDPDNLRYRSMRTLARGYAAAEVAPRAAR
jgi:glycosyltransferase involved in cell wall biosynthesis